MMCEMTDTMMLFAQADSPNYIYKIYKLIMMYNKLHSFSYPFDFVRCIATAYVNIYNDRLPEDIRKRSFEKQKVVLVQYSGRMCVEKWFSNKGIHVEHYKKNCDNWLEYAYTEPKEHYQMIKDIDDFIYKRMNLLPEKLRS